MANTLVFIHGLESTAQGMKGRFFARNFPEMIIEDFTGNLDTRMSKLKKILAGKQDLIIVGSSYGGLMGVQFAMEHEKSVKKLILLAPALNLPEFPKDFAKKLGMPVIIYHGKNDDVVDPYQVRKIASEIFTSYEHYLVEDDHPLHKTFAEINWHKLLADT